MLGEKSKKEFECFQDAIVLQGSVLQFRSHHRISYFVPFIYRIDTKQKSRKNAQMRLKFSRNVDFSARRFHRCSQICQKFQQVVVNETASAWRHEKEVLPWDGVNTPPLGKYAVVRKTKFTNALLEISDKISRYYTSYEQLHSLRVDVVNGILEKVRYNNAIWYVYIRILHSFS